MYLATWRPDAAKADAVATLKAGTNCERSGSVESSSLQDLRNEFTIDYGLDARTDKTTRRLTLTGDPAEVEGNDDAEHNHICRRSFMRYGRRPADPITSDVLWDDATALRVLQWRARRYALPSFAVSYRCRPDLAWLEPGNVVTITDADLSLTAAVALVELVAPDAGGDVGVRLRIYEAA
jgi:hypothetical protein